MQPLYSETSRSLAALAYSSGQLVTGDLPPDTVLRALSLRLSGSVVATYSSTPLAKETSTLSDLLNSISVEINGRSIIKNVYPHILHMHYLLARKIQGERKCSAAAAAAYNNNPTVDAGFTFPTSTQVATVAETVVVPFEMIFCQVGAEKSWLDLRGTSSAVLKLSCAAITNLDKTTNATFSSISFSFQPVTLEVKDWPVQPEIWDWKETYKVQQFAAAATDTWVDLPAGNLYAALSMFVRQDAAGAGADAVSFKPGNNTVRQIRIRLNGREILSTTFQDLQAQNRIRFGVQAPFATNQSRLDGFAMINFLTKDLWSAALDTSRSGVNSFQVGLTVAATDSTYNKLPADVMLHSSEFVKR